MFRSFHLILTLVIGSISATHAADAFHEVKAESGDGIYSLLRRYQLDNYACNFEKFYELNQIKPNTALRIGKTYQLPILIYPFNGKTIRSSIGIDDYDRALRIQHYNEAMYQKSYRKTAFRKDKVLWVPYHELHCPDQSLRLPAQEEETTEKTEEIDDEKATDPAPPKDEVPPAKPPAENTKVVNKNRVFPIFGDKYAYTPLQSNKLRGKVFYIVAGHGGPDPGAVGKRSGHRLCEDEYAYDVALRLCRNLIAHGATAYMVNRDKNDGIRENSFLKCDADEVLWGDVKMVRHHKTRLFQRSDIVNELFDKHKWQGVEDQIAIMIHVDSRQGRERTDLYFYHHPDSRKSRNVAEVLRKTMITKYNFYQKNRHYTGTVSARDLHMLREIKPLAVYVELANILNSVDQQRIVIPKNRQLLADWLFAGIINLQ